MFHEKTNSYFDVSENGDDKRRGDSCVSPTLFSTVPKKRNYYGRMEPWVGSAFKGSSTPDSSMDIDTSPSYYSPANPTFLESTLADFGLMMSEDGQGIIELSEDPLSVIEGSRTLSYPTFSPSSRSPGGSTDDSPTSYVSSPLCGDALCSSPLRKKTKQKKSKMFEMPPVNDDDNLEKRRVNALNAKKNRDKKKEELTECKKEIEHHKEINRRMCQALKKSNSVQKELGDEVQHCKELLTVKDLEIQAKSREIRQRREEMILMRGHLDIISGSLDDHNPAKSLILSLLNKLSISHEVSSSYR